MRFVSVKHSNRLSIRLMATDFFVSLSSASQTVEYDPPPIKRSGL